MSFESLKFTTQPAGRQPEKESLKANVENILDGHGIEEVTRVGWQKYREALASVSYADIIGRQANQIELTESEQKQKSGSIPEWLIHNKNIEAGERAYKLSEWFTGEYAEDKQFSFFASQDRNKKLIVQGREKMVDDKGAPIDNQLVRIYFTVPTMHSPEAYKALFDALVDEDAMNRVQLTLNLENYTGDSQDKPFENNTIIVYVYGKDSDLITKVVRAIEGVKKESKAELWKFSQNDLLKVKESIVKDFMVPLDDTTAFVEAKNLGSYHSGPRGRMFHEITGELPTQKMDINKLAEKFRPWTPQRPGLLDQDPERRRFMPALIFE